MTTPRPRSRPEIKAMVQDVIMDHVAKALSYYNPDDYGKALSAEDTEHFHLVMKREADRVARLMGYEEAWRA